MEEKKANVKTEVIPEEDELLLATFSGVRQFKSLRRAIRRGNASKYGEVYPKKPFNCRKATSGRKKNEEKKRIYNELKRFN